MTKNKLIILIISGFNLVFLVLLAILSLCTALAPTVNKFGLYQPIIAIFFGSVMLNIVLVFLANIKIKKINKLYIVIPATVAIFIAILIAQVLFAHALLSDGYTWDSNTIYQAAVKYIQTNTLPDDIKGYLAVSPNNVPLFIILSQLFKAMHAFGYNNFLWGAVLLNVALTFISQILIFFVAKMLFGLRIAFCSLIFGFVLLGLNMHIQTPYTDTLTVVFPILLFFLSLLFIKYRTLAVRLLLAFAIGLTAIVGYLIKPTVIIALIALLIVGFAWLISENKKILNKKGIILASSSVVMLVIGAFGTYLTFSAYADSQKLLPYSYVASSRHGLPPQHFINIGMKTKINGYSVNYGGYDDSTAQIVSNLSSYDARVAYSNNSISQQLINYGPLGYASFIGHKVMWIISDATFFAYGEGDISRVNFKSNDQLSINIRQFATPFSKNFLLFGNVMQVFWVALLFLIGLQLIISVLWKPARVNPFLTTLHLMITGILLFLIIFEGRSRYIFLYVPIFIVTGMYTLNWFRNITKDHSPQLISTKDKTKLVHFEV